MAKDNGDKSIDNGLIRVPRWFKTFRTENNGAKILNLMELGVSRARGRDACRSRSLEDQRSRGLGDEPKSELYMNTA